MRQHGHTGFFRSVVRFAFLSPVLFLFLTLGPAGAQSNPIVIENQQPGSSAWDIPTDHLANDTTRQIKGYASATSVNKGEDITFYVTTNVAETYTIDVYRIGWYQGLGGRLMQHIGPLNGSPQPTCPMDATTGMIECHWAAAYTLSTQTSWTSGIYLGVLTNAQGYQNLIIFCVRDDSRNAALLYQQPVTTYQAYNAYPDDGLTGKSLYDFDSFGVKLAATGYKSAAKVSFDRPYQDSGIDEGFRSDYGEVNFIRWMERSGYDVTYATDVDTHANPSRLLNYRGVLSMGHDEYWSGPMYDAAIAARDAGVSVGFFGADAVSWQIRFESSTSGVPNRVVVCYKDATLDPITDQTLKTVEWRDPVLNRPEQVLMGIQYNGLSYPPQNNQGFFPSYVVTNSGNWVYAGTGMKDGDSAKGIVGYESDRFDNTFPSPNAVSGTYALLSHSPWGSGPYDYGNSSVYQAPSGAWVFATGAMSWNWALDDYGHGYNMVDPRIQQVTTNVLNQFVAGSGAQPSLTVTSVTPSNGLIAGGTPITIQGTNFASGATVNVGSTAATGVAFVNSSTITANTPAGAVGTVSVTVTNPDGRTGTMANAFTYTSTAPTVAGVSPNNGLVAGGTSVTLTGVNYALGATVTVGGLAATSVTVVNSTTITATTPAHAAGAADITVMNTDGQFGTLVAGFVYQLPPPTVTSVLPVSGTASGGTAITISGANFVTGAKVTLGATAATGITVVDSSTITATTPAHAAGAVNVTVTNSDGQSATLASSYTYILSAPAPTVTGVSPNSGLTTGGTAVTITGTGFAAGAKVTFASTAATGVTVVSDTTITATTPAHAVGAVKVTVTNPDTQLGSLASAFIYNTPSAPTLASVTPNSGLRGFAIPVTLIGTNFTVTGTKVTVSGTGITVSAVTVVDPVTISATFTFTSSAGLTARNVTVTTPGGTSNIQTFTVLGPTLTSIDPTSGLRGTSVPVTLTGTGLTGATKITVSGSGVTVSNLTPVDDTSVTATFTITAGAGATARTVSVTTPAGTTKTQTFTVLGPTLTSISPNPVTHGTGVLLTLTGTNLSGATKVTVSNSGSTCVVTDSTSTTVSATCTLTAGSKTVKVTTPIGVTAAIALTVN